MTTSVDAAAGPLAVEDSSRVRLHDLATRQDGDEWIVGRMATGDFVALPAVGYRAIGLLNQGSSIGDVQRRLEDETGTPTDITAFVRDLVALGFVTEIDSLHVPTPRPARTSLSRLRPERVRWLLHPVTSGVPLALIVAAVLTLCQAPHLFPTYRSLLWSPHGSLVLTVEFAVGWSMVLLHEFAHLLTARAADVPARITLGTRLQFLVAQTDVSGIVIAPRRQRLTVYLSGIAVNLTIASACILALAATGDPDNGVGRALSVLTLLAMLPLPFQFLVFMRTDIYFALEDLTRCKDLYTDGTAYAHHLAQRAARRLRNRSTAPTDPSANLPPGERRAVRIYSIILVIGTTLTLAAMTFVTLPTDVGILSRAANRLGTGDITATLDALAVLTILGGAHLLWATLWWRHHRHRIHHWLPTPRAGIRGARRRGRTTTPTGRT